MIINIASVGGLRAEFGLGVYNVTKAALIHLTRQLAGELGPTRVVGIAPGLVQTDFAALLVENFGDDLAARCRPRRLGEPEDIANLAVFLASDKASWITGETYVIDGGAERPQHAGAAHFGVAGSAWRSRSPEAGADAGRRTLPSAVRGIVVDEHERRGAQNARERRLDRGRERVERRADAVRRATTTAVTTLAPLVVGRQPATATSATPGAVAQHAPRPAPATRSRRR